MMDVLEERAVIATDKMKYTMSLEIEFYERTLIELEKKGKNKEETASIWMEVAARKDLYRQLYHVGFESTIDINRKQKALLIKLFNMFKGYGWTKKHGWIGFPKTAIIPELRALEGEVCYYEGITSFKWGIGKTATQNTLGVDFQGIGCDGLIPTTFGDLETCKFLHLNWNLIKGSLPSSLSRLDNIEILNLSSNLLQGNLDINSFSSFLKIQKLDLSFNQFIGYIPDCFDKMKHLKFLNLSDNNFHGELPDSMSCLKDLEVLKCYQNNLHGHIPDWISTLNLRDVNLSQNQFTSGLDSFYNCSNLKKLVLNNNKINDYIHPNIQNMKSLNLLHLQNNEICLRIPNEICELTFLKYINFSNNKLVGVLPENIGNLVNLSTLIINDNEIIGPVPLSMSKLTNLKDFHIFKNYPSERMTSKRGFKRQSFERVFIFAPTLHIDNVSWDSEVLYGEKHEDITDKKTLDYYAKHYFK